MGVALLCTWLLLANCTTIQTKSKTSVGVAIESGRTTRHHLTDI